MTESWNLTWVTAVRTKPSCYEYVCVCVYVCELPGAPVGFELHLIYLFLIHNYTTIVVTYISHVFVQLIVSEVKASKYFEKAIVNMNCQGCVHIHNANTTVKDYHLINSLPTCNSCCSFEIIRCKAFWV